MNVVEVPHWAMAMVSNYRTLAGLPASVTDERIYGILRDVEGWDEADKIEELKERTIHE